MASTTAPMNGTGEPIKPDREFIREVVSRGGDSVKKCFQCGTCAVTCLQPSAREGASYPRRQMLLTQWGLKDKVLGDPDIWLCHQCNDCSVRCPRGAKPGDVLAALRSMAIEHFSFPRFLARWFADPRFLPLMFGIPAVILLSLVAALQGFDYPAGKIEYDRFISDRAIEIAGGIVATYVIVVATVSTLRFWRAIRAAAPLQAALAAVSAPSDGPGAMAATAPVPSPTASLISTAGDIATHKGFRQCEAEKPRLWGHLAVFWGAPFLLAATALAALYSFVGAEVQRPPSDPAKVLGNLGAILLFVGVGIFVYNRLRTRKGAWGRATYSDWLLLGMLLSLVVTGAFLELDRYTGAGSVAYSLYLVHLVIVFAAFVYAPYGKFAHVFYRTVALALAGRGKSGGVLLGKRTRAAVEGAVLAVLMGLLAWHTILWHMNGQQAELFNAIGDNLWGTVKGVGYNLGLMASAGALLGLFMERFTDVIGYEVKKIEHFAEEEEVESEAAAGSRPGEQPA